MEGSSFVAIIDGGNKGTPIPKYKTSNVYMMKSYLNFQTRAHDYGNSESVKEDKELPVLSKYLHIDK
jgi:hypothetical protein